MIPFIRAYLSEMKRDNIGAFACQTAFFVILSFIPFMMVFISLIQYTPITESSVLFVIKKLMPDYIAPLMVSIVKEVFSKSVGILSMAIITAIWSAAKGIQYLSNGLNVIYDLEETRNWLVLRIRAMIYTVYFLIVIVFCLGLLMFGNKIQSQINKNSPFFAKIMSSMIHLRLVILLFLLIFFFVILFKALPNKKTTMLSQLPGAVIAAISWYVLSFGISIYVGYFNGFSMYGSLTTIVLMMLWVYFCMYILLLCAELNSMIGETFEKKIHEKHKNRKMKKEFAKLEKERRQRINS